MNAPQLRIAVVGLEPALRYPILQLLGQQPDFAVTCLDPSHGGKSQADSPDLLLAGPVSRSRLHELRENYPDSYILARVPWDREQYWNCPDLDERLDELASFEEVLATLRRIGAQRTGGAT